MKTVHQVLVGAERHDAITNMALEIREVLRSKFNSDIYSFHAPNRELQDKVRGIDELSDGRPEDIIIYHQSFGIPELTSFLRNRQERLILHYHNVTPSSRYRILMPSFAEALDYGRLELQLLKPQVTKAMAASLFNAQELHAYGYENVAVFPAGLNPRRLDDIPIDPVFLLELSSQFPHGFILFVSQVLPHKRVEHALAMIHLLRTVCRLDVGLVVAGPIRQPMYMQALKKFRSKLNDCHVLFTDSVSDSELATLYRACICYVGTSEHEGLSVPPLEAMANGAPVVVRGAGAVPETVGSGGIVLDGSVGLMEFTEVIARLVQSSEMQSHLRRSGLLRVAEIESDLSRQSLTELLWDVVK